MLPLDMNMYAYEGKNSFALLCLKTFEELLSFSFFPVLNLEMTFVMGIFID